MLTPKVYVVIPNWNGADYIKSCVDSLLGQSFKHTVVIVENGSVDESDAILATYGKKITVLKQKVNLGFAGGVNVGLQYALDNGADYVALFNNDAVADKNWLKYLVESASEQGVGIVTSKFMRMDKKALDSTGDFYTTYGLPFPRGRNEQDTGQYDKQLSIFGASGGASLYSAKMLNKIGLFDEDYFAYFEDVDISFRAQLAGWQVRFAPKAIAYHHVGGTSNKISGFATHQSAKNFWFVYIKNMPGRLFYKYLIFATYWYVRMFVARLVRGGSGPFIKGYFKFLVLLPKKVKQRRQIQKNRTVSIGYIDSILHHGRPPKPPKK